MIVAAVGVGIFVALAFGASVILRAGDEPETPALPTPTSGTVVGAEALAVGDCLILPSEEQFDEVRKLGCSEPHDAEVFFVGNHPDGDYPTDAAFESFVNEQCVPVFETYTGSTFEDQEVLDIGWFTPTSGAWDGGDRQVVCHLTSADGSRSSQSWAGGNP